MNVGLKQGAVGTEVERLHRVLTSLGIAVADDEREGKAFGPSTLEALRAFQRDRGLPATDHLDRDTLELLLGVEANITVNINDAPPATPKAPNPHHGKVTGTLTDGDGAPMPSVRVALFQQLVRSETKLADGTTTEKGTFELRYHRRGVAPNLFVRAMDDRDKTLAQSATTYAAPQDATIDLTAAADGVVRTLSKFTSLEKEVEAQLGGVSFTSLVENAETHELQFVASATGQSFGDVADLYIARVLGAANALRAETLFGAFGEGIPATLAASLASLPATGIDSTFTGNVLSGVLAHTRAALSQALTAALTANLIPASYAETMSDELDRLDDLRTAAAGNAAFGVGTTTLNQVLTAGSVPQAVQTAFLQAYASNGGQVVAAVSTVSANASISKADVATLTSTLTASQLFLGSTLLVQATLPQLAGGTLANLQSLALVTTSEWVTRITALDPQGSTLPPLSTGDSPTARIAAFAASVTSQIAEAYPTMAFAGALQQNPNVNLTTRAQLASFLVANPTFDLAGTNIDQFVSASATPLDSALLTDLKTVQRIARITTNTTSMLALTTAGYTSAQKIYATGFGPFVANMATALGDETSAQQVFSQAELTYATALTTFAQYHASFNPFPIHVFPNPTPSADALKALPTLQSLFGSLDYCQCPDCRSVYSPAAYLVDLLHWLSARAASGGSNACAVLLGRRSDLQYIALSCNNTNVIVPYIDLVNEVLEAAVAGTGGSTTVIQTQGATADRLAIPQFLNTGAYWTSASSGGSGTPPPTTSTVPFPLSLPFSLPFAQATAYLNALGTSLSAVLSLFQGATGGPSAGAIAGAALGVNPGLRAVITGTDTYQPYQRWGFPEASGQVIDPNTREPYPSALAWDAALGKVPVLLQRSGLTLQQLLQLLEVQWVTLGGVTLSLGSETINGHAIVSCDTELMSFTGLTDGVLDRAQRFLRLWTESGLQMWELDWALEPPPGQTAPRTLDDTFLAYLTGAMAVQTQLSLPFQEVLSFWCPLETRDVTSHLGDEDVTVPSTYTEVFLNAAVQQAWSGVFGTTQTGSSGLNTTLPILPPTGGGATAASAASAINAALGLSTGDMTAIFAAVAPGTSPTLTLDNLNTLFCYARLSASLKLSVPDLLLWIQLTGGTPFGVAAGPAGTLEFLRRYKVLTATGIAAPDLDYLLRNQSLAETSLLFTQDQALATLQSIAVAFSKAPQITQAATSGVQTALPTARSIGPTRVEAIFVQALAAATGAPSSVVQVLLDATGILSWTPAPPATPPQPPVAAPWLEQLASLNGGPVSASVFSTILNSFVTIAKGAALAVALTPTVTQLSALIAGASAGGWLDPSSLPATGTIATSPYGAFEALLFALALDRRQPSSGCGLFAVYAGTATPAPPQTSAAPLTAVDYLAQALDGSAADVAALATVFGATTPSAVQPPPQAAPSLASVAMLHAIAQALDVCARYEVSGATLANLATGLQAVTVTDAQATIANSAMAALQAQYPQSAWNAAVTPVENTLRQQRRDALVGYLLAWGPNPAIGTPLLTTDDIFNYYLIDPEMSAGGQTTRLLQASLAVQQFVQQCYLNLVDAVTVDPTVDAGWNEWSWMQQYRLWQANREVFLYPENYLLPEVRSNQSPFFSDLVNAMRQGNYDADSAESAFETYLRSLVQVSRLVVGAHYNEVNADGSSTLHVFARTRGTPPQWFYRQRTTPAGGSSTWAAWQPLNLDIGDNAVVPFIRDRRLHILWPTFKSVSEQPGTQQNPTSSNAAPPAHTFWSVEFAMSEYSAGQWQPKVTFSEKMYFDTTDPPQAFTFSALQLGAPTFALQINAYYTRLWFPTTLIDARERAALAPDMVRLVLATDLVATGTQDVPEAPLVVQEIQDVLPTASIVNPSQEPSYSLIVPDTLTGQLATPAGYSYSGQDLVYGGYWSSNPGAVALNVLAPGWLSILFSTTTLNLLGSIQNPRIVIPQQEQGMNSRDPFFVADPAHVFFVEPTTTLTPISVDGWWSIWTNITTYEFSPFYHPFARTFLRELELGGIDQLMQRNLQLYPQYVSLQASFDFSTYTPTTSVNTQLPPVENVDFTPGGAYSLYNWELFYHAPMFVAGLLSQNQQFQDAMTWYEYIFNPTDPNAPAPPGAPAPPPPNPPTSAHFWNFAVLNQLTSTDWSNQDIDNLLTSLAAGVDVNGTTAAIADWIANPFDPDLVAQLRPAAYGKATVMKFLDNLIAWGDSLFAQNTMEMVNQAEQLYIIADMILGPQPQQVRVPKQYQPYQEDSTSYATIAGSLDGFSNALVDVENLVRVPLVSTLPILLRPRPWPPLPRIHWVNEQTLFFCIPPNPTLFAYWDTVADRLYKIRNQLNLQGQPQPPALYAPPINPAALVAAAAGGSDATGAIPPPPLYRFVTYYQRAVELANDVRSLGALILSALEKKDAEALALLRATQEIQIQNLMLAVKQQQLVEAQDQVVALQKQKAVVQVRYDYYSTLSFLNDWETAAIAMQGAALILNAVGVVLDLTSGAAHLVPTFSAGVAGFGGSPMVNVNYGGDNVGSSLTAFSTVAKGLAGILQEGGSMAATMGGYQRRQAEWTMQANASQAELAQMDAQIQAANDRVQTATNEITLQNQQIANAQAISDFLTSKFTSEQLYDWLLSQLTTVYTQAYQLAYDLATRAQTAYNYELCRQDTFLQAGYWNSQYKGLTAGELLLFDLRRMDAQFLENNTRELELTKHVSLALTQPLALVALKQTGVCAVDLDEALFDQDHPGHFYRRLRSVALTIPCVSGPYTGVNANLTLGPNAIRMQAITAGSAGSSPLVSAASLSQPTFNQPGITVNGAPLTGTLVTSTAQNDAGLFEANLRDERWLPFEGQGAISQWTLELNPADNAIDLSTVTDVVIHVRYTARLGGDPKTVRALASPAPTGSRSILVSVRNTFGDAYYSFFNPTDTTATQQVLTLPLTTAIFPFSNYGTPKISSILVLLPVSEPSSGGPAGVTIPATWTPAGSGAFALAFTPPSAASNSSLSIPPTFQGRVDYSAAPTLPGTFTLTVSAASAQSLGWTTVNGVLRLDPSVIQDVALVITYSVS